MRSHRWLRIVGVAVVIGWAFGALVIAGPDPVRGASASQVLWSTGLESGTFDDFYDITPSGCSDWDVVSSPVHSGSRAGALSVCNGSGGVRMRVEHIGDSPKSLPDDAVYSVWMNLGSPWSGDNSNFFQFKKAVVTPNGKTKHVIAGLYAAPDASANRFEIQLKSKISPEGVWDGKQRVLGAGTFVPANAWVKVELRYKWGAGDGLIQVWIDDQLAYDIPGRYTDPQKIIHRSGDGGTGEVTAWVVPGTETGVSGERQWTVNHYLQNSSPANTTIHFDDAAVTLGRAGTVASAVSSEPYDGQFSDDDGSVHEPAIETLAEQGVVRGCNTSGSKFCPNDPVTRAELSVIVTGAMNEDTASVSDSGFSDVPDGAWYAAAVARLAELGIVNGRPGGRFSPDDLVTRAEVAAVIVRAAGWDPATGSEFTDVPRAAWYAGYVERLLQRDVTRGCSISPLRYCPQAAVTRGEVATLVVRAFGLP